MRRPTAGQAIRQWPEAHSLAMAQPTDENLQKLCSLLDILDAWVVQGWDSHPDRRRTLSRLRGEAAEARRAVEARNRSRSAERAAAAKAKKERLDA